MTDQEKQSDDVIKNGYRLNVGMIIVNDENAVFWGCRKSSRNAWQFPQGGVMQHETLREAMYRELEEEVGLKTTDVEILSKSKRWYRYRIPPAFQRPDRTPCIGQQQRWFLLRLTATDGAINLQHSDKPEFSRWCWADYWYPAKGVAPFKRDIYQSVLTEFSPILGLSADPEQS